MNRPEIATREPGRALARIASLAISGALIASCGAASSAGSKATSGAGTTIPGASAATTFSIPAAAAAKALIVGGTGGDRTDAYLVDTATRSILGTIGFGYSDPAAPVTMNADASMAYLCTRDPALGDQTAVIPLDLSNFSAGKAIPLGTNTFNLGCAGIAPPSTSSLLVEVGNSLIEVSTAGAGHKVVAKLPGTQAGRMRFAGPAGIAYIPRQVGARLELLPFATSSYTLGAPITLGSLAPAQMAGMVFSGAGLAWALVTRSGSITGSWMVPVRTAARSAGTPIALPSTLIPSSLAGAGDSLYLLAYPGPLQRPAIYAVQPAGSTPKELVTLPGTWAAEVKLAAGGLVVTMGTSSSSAAIGVLDPADPSGLTALSVPMAAQAGPSSIAIPE